MTKKILLFTMLIGTILLLPFFYRPFNYWLYDFCFPTGRCLNFLVNIDFIGHFFLLAPPLFLLSLITYKMRDEVFRAWWNFARWWVPVIILVTYLQSTQAGGGGLGIGGAISSGFDILILGFFYAILVIVSLWRIVRKYRQLKREGK